MKTRLLSLLLAVIMLTGLLPTTAFAAATEEEALGEVNIYNSGQTLSYFSVNGRVQRLTYVYFNYTRPDGTTSEIPAYCVNPTEDGVAQTVGAGESVGYIANERASDPKVMGIVANGYPGRPLSELGLDNVCQGYCATKIALWCYLLSSWDINKVAINPSLTGMERDRAERMLAAAKDIYQRGMTWDKILTPNLSITADQAVAYPVTVDGTEYKQQIFTVTSETPVESTGLSVAFADPDSAPTGTRIVDMNDRDISKLDMADGSSVQFKVLYPIGSIEGQDGSVQLTFGANVRRYAVFYALCAETSKYGTLQNYICDTDPYVYKRLSAISYFGDESGPVSPDIPDDPETEDPIPQESWLEIIKLESGTETPLSGAVFEIVDPDGITIGSFATDESGRIELPVTKAGNYTIYEREAPEYHLLSDTQAQNVSVEAGSTATVTFQNDPYSDLRVEKVSNTGDKLEDAVIQIKHIESGRTLTESTSSAGVAMFEQLKPGAYEITELTAPKGYEKDPAVHTVTLVPGELTTFFLVNKELPGLRIIKYDRKNMEAMADVTFEVWRDGVSLGTFRTDCFGEIVLKDVQPGTYRAFEVDTGSDGYILDTTPQEVELKAGDGIKELLFFNDIKPGLHLMKVDSLDPSKVIPNAVFEIKAVAGDYGPEEFITDESGEIDLGKLPAGAYVITEKSCTGYVVDAAQRIIQLNPNEDAQFVFTNSKRPGMNIIKLDSYDSKPLGGVTFRIAKIEDGSHYLDRVTDQNGRIYVDDLDSGIYSVTEIDTPEGYILNETEWHVELFPGRDSTLVVTNDRKSDLTIIKTDADTGAPVSGVTFTVKKVDSSTITTVVTDRSGSTQVQRLEPGVYQITEQRVPEGYLLDTTPQLVTLFPNRNAEVRFQNYKRPTLTIHKVDMNGQPLTGAIFEVNSKDGVKIGDFPVDKNGSVTVSNVHLTEGYYIITEKQAPNGYILDSTFHEVYLRPGKTTEISIENEKKPDLIIQKLDSIVKDGLKGAKFEIWVAKDKSTDGAYERLDNNFYYTDAQGRILLDDLDTGWYKIVEVEPPAGYELKVPSEQTVYVDNDTSVTVTFENIPKSALVISKVDADTGAGLSGAWFRVRYLGGTSGTGGTVIGEYQTSTNGNILVTGLSAGTYVVEEISAPNGYVLDAAAQTAYISGKEQDVVTLTFTNSKYGSLLIKKVDSVTGKPLSDVQFYVTDSSGAVIGSGNGYFVTDSAGTILISDILPGTTLVVKETRTVSGYVLDDTPQTVKVQANATMTLEFRNQPKGGLVIQKVDSETGEPLAGVEFKITAANGELVADNEGLTSSNGIYTTDENGQIVLYKLQPGTYIVTETKTLDTHILDAAPQTVVVNAGDTQTLTFRNTPKGSLLITKLDSVTREPLSGVRFRIAGCNGCEYPAGTYTTDANGNVRLNSIPSGCYAITELEAKHGYLLDNTTHTVKVTGGSCKEITFTNVPLGGLIIKKMDAVTKAPLADTIFKVTTADGAVVGSSYGQYRTDERGYITISDLEPGSYIVREVQAKTGYLLDDTPRTIQIKDHQTYELEFFNQPLGGLIIHKLDSVTKQPLQGVQFKITYADGRVVDAADGALSSNGLYWTDENGQIKLSGIIGTIVVTEMETIDGYTIDENTRSQTIKVNTNDTQSLYFYNDPVGGVDIIKVNEADKSERLAGAVFEIRRMDDGLIDTVTTDKNGHVFLPLNDGSYYAVETEAPEGFHLNSTPVYFEVKDGKTTVLTVTNKPVSGILIHKIDSTTGEGIYGVTFLLYDSSKKPIGQYVSDQDGWVYMNDLPGSGRYFIRELENEGYNVDTQLKTVYIKPGKVIEIEWENEPITGQIQIYKYAAEYNAVTGTAPGTPLEGAVYEIINARSGKVVDYITTDARGVAASKLLPLTRYQVREVTAPTYWQVDPKVHDVTLEYAGQIIKLSAFDKAAQLGVSITKRGNAAVLAGSQMRYDITLANTSNVDLESFFWHDRFPSDIARPTMLTTGTYSARLTYRVLYKTNYSASYQVLASNLLTSNNYSFALNAIPMQPGETVTDVFFDFGTVPVGFQSVSNPTVTVIVNGNSVNGYQLVNRADAGGKYQGTWQTAQASWVTLVQRLWSTPTLPKTGY